MSRTARKKSKTGIYHIVLRGINRQIKDFDFAFLSITEHKKLS
jgi:hypothetical protein